MFLSIQKRAFVFEKQTLNTFKDAKAIIKPNDHEYLNLLLQAALDDENFFES